MINKNNDLENELIEKEKLAEPEAVINDVEVIDTLEVDDEDVEEE